jgi:tRNA pseudouridine38-40 synthase
VHAQDYIAHFDTSLFIEDGQLKFKLNRFLPNDIVIHKLWEVNPENHARFDAISRSYKYKLHISKDPFAFHSFYYNYAVPKLVTLNEVANLFTRYTDFTAFCKTNSGNSSNICKITECYWTQNGDHFIFNITANRFLRGMIRLLIGASLNVDRGTISIQDVEIALSKGSRLSKDWSVPGHGLTLYGIKYPYEVF